MFFLARQRERSAGQASVVPENCENASITRKKRIAIPINILYLTAILDIASRKVLAWRLSNTLTTDFCLDALNEPQRASALAYRTLVGRPPPVDLSMPPRVRCWAV